MCRGVHIGEHWECLRTDLFRITLGWSNSFLIVKDSIIYGTRLKPATLPDIHQNDTIYLLEAVISQPVCYWRSDALCHRPRAASRTVNSLSSGANYSPTQSCAGPTFASVHGTEKDISDPLGDEIPV